MKRGFTLIELLMLIAIIVILSSIVLTSIQSARHKSKCLETTGNKECTTEQLDPSSTYRW